MQRKGKAEEKLLDGGPNCGFGLGRVHRVWGRRGEGWEWDVEGLVGGFGGFVGKVKGAQMIGRSRRRGIGGGGVVVSVPSSVADVEEAPPNYAHAPREQDQPDGGDQNSAAPGQEKLQNVDGGTAEKDGGGNGFGHGGMVQLGEAERRLAQLAVFLLRVGQPLHQTFLVDVFDAAAALAGVEERFLGGALSPTDSTCIGIVLVWQVVGGQGWLVVQGRVVVMCRSHGRGEEGGAGWAAGSERARRACVGARKGVEVRVLGVGV